MEQSSCKKKSSFSRMYDFSSSLENGFTKIPDKTRSKSSMVLILNITWNPAERIMVICSQKVIETLNSFQRTNLNN